MTSTPDVTQLCNPSAEVSPAPLSTMDNWPVEHTMTIIHIWYLNYYVEFYKSRPAGNSGASQFPPSWGSQRRRLRVQDTPSAAQGFQWLHSSICFRQYRTSATAPALSPPCCQSSSEQLNRFRSLSSAFISSTSSRRVSRRREVLQSIAGHRIRTAGLAYPHSRYVWSSGQKRRGSRAKRTLHAPARIGEAKLDGERSTQCHGQSKWRIFHHATAYTPVCRP